MAAIYLFSTLLFAFFLIFGFSFYRKQSFQKNFVQITLFALLLRVLLAFSYGFSFTVLINTFFDLLLSYVIFSTLKTKLSVKQATLCSALFLFNPALYTHTLTENTPLSLFLLLFYFLFVFFQKRMYFISFLTYFALLLFQPKLLFLSPVFILYFYKQFKEYGFKNILLKLLPATLFFTTILIFYYKFFDQTFMSTLQNDLTFYPYITNHAYNIWSMIGLDLTDRTSLFFGLNTAQLLFPLVIIITVFSIYISSKQADSTCYLPYFSFLQITLLYLFLPGMNYLFLLPCILLLLYLFFQTESSFYYTFYVIFSLLHFMNIIYRNTFFDNELKNPYHPLLIVPSFLFIIATSYFLFSKKKNRTLAADNSTEIRSESQTGIESHIEAPVSSTLKNVTTNCEESLHPIARWFQSAIHEKLAVLILTFVFAFLAFYRLGSLSAPETQYQTTYSQPDIVFRFDKPVAIGQISLFLNHLGSRSYAIDRLDENSSGWISISESETANSVFAWNKIELHNNVYFLRLTSLDSESGINELVIQTESGATILPSNASDYPTLFDEQNTFPEVSSYLSNTIFDEIYHARTAYEFIHGLTTYETTHPPLGKILMEIGILLFGMNPFGWRFMSVILGTFCIPLFYYFAKKIMQSPFYAFCTTFIFTFDFMHFSLSRIATIDIYAAFFILFMYFFIYDFLSRTINQHSFQNTKASLAACGMMMGLGIATKWTAIYAAIGLAFFLFYTLWEQYKKNLSKWIKTCLFCIPFFVLIPLFIYVLSYLPFVSDIPDQLLLKKIIDNNQFMFSYHANLTETHYYGSKWYEWPIIKMPLLYVFDMVTTTNSSSISCFGNPAIWWFGIPSMCFMLYLWTHKKDKRAAFLCISYFVQFIPWMFIHRVVFIYHYFPSSLFMMLSIGYTLQKISQHCKKGLQITLSYCALVFVLFILFYPVISGIPTNRNWALVALRWLKEWILVL